MTQHLLDRPQVCAAFQQVCGKGMTERVREGSESFLDDTPYAPDMQWTPPDADPQRRIRLLPGKNRASFFNVVGHRFPGYSPDRNNTLLVAFSDNANHVRPDVANLQGRNLGNPQPGGVQHFENGPVSQVDRAIAGDTVEGIS